MDNEYKSQLFRLAAVLYLDNNYEVTPKTIHRKVIESVFIESSINQITIHQIIDYIQENYKIVFDEETVNEVISDKERFVTNKKDANVYVSLSDKRKQLLASKVNANSIDFFIEQFAKEDGNLFESIDFKSTIYRFLYDVFLTNANSFQKILNTSKDLSCLINIESTTYSDVEKNAINSFLSWNLPEKNKAIFDISSYALEYCMLTNNGNSNTIHLNNLKNKYFYLDTNIIYRALGINGDDRMKRSGTFLKKFSDAGETLIISKYTDLEFKEGIKSHVDRIRKFYKPKVHSEVYQDVNVQKDIFSFYHKWRAGRVNSNLELFLAFILSEYQKFKDKFGIDTDVVVPFDSAEKDVNTIISDYSQSIQTFKSSEGHDIIGSATVDAENILWIEKKRDGQAHSIFDAKYFLISTDQGLRRWDYQRSFQTPIVLLPSQWMSVILRYVNRTDDDFGSFVSFLNLKSNDTIISSEKLHIVLSGISEMTSDISQQYSLIQTLIEGGFNGVLEKGYSNEQIFEKASSFAESELEKAVDDLKYENEKLSQKLSIIGEKVEQTNKEIERITESSKKDKGNLEVQLDDQQKENVLLKDKITQLEIEKKLGSWKINSIWWILILAALITYFILVFLLNDWDYNFPHRLNQWRKGLEDDFKKYVITALMYAPLIGIWLILKNVIWVRLISAESINEKRKKIEEGLKSNIHD